MVGGNGGLTRIICGIGEKRKTGRVHVACACIRANVCERREWEKKDGKCMKRERNDGKRDGGNTWNDSLGPS